MALEILGGVCAVGQLAGQCSYVLEVVDKVRRSTDTLKGYQTQLQDLRGLCEVIKENPLLQTTEVISHAQSILKTTEQLDDLNILLQKRRLHRVWTFLRVERRLVEQTKNIETLKSTLAISIQDQQCRILHDMDERAQRISAMQSTRQLELRQDHPIFRTRIPVSNMAHALVVRQPGTHQPPQRVTNMQTARITETRPGGARSASGHRPGMPGWTNNNAYAGTHQVNGNTYLGLTRGGTIDARGQRWVNNRKDGWGGQSNGYTFMSTDDDGYLSVPKVEGGSWDGNEYTNSQNGNDSGQGISEPQYNGHFYGHGPGRNR